ncbi:hypothetical protein AB1Y20_016610 [Prymnesium parvum]|uniref:Uncharacterized protein n=1 Tax=Prymnesium parvum TaxID=97485 RepID=A0AB34ID93_PRYPA
MAAVPIHAAVAVPAEYSLAFAASGAPAAVNASDMKCSWHLIEHVVSYAQLNELMWCVAECDADLRSVRFVLVRSGLPRSPLRTWSAVCTVLARCAQSLSGAAAASRRLTAGDLRR